VARKKAGSAGATGRLRIGDDWNAISIIALSQENPLKAVAEFVENSIDARARHVAVTRGRERGEHFLSIVDDGEGVPRDREGLPDFHYVATHICDSIKRRLKIDGARGIQGEFGIGLLSFWTVGEELAMSSAGADGHTYEMRMKKGNPAYSVQRRRTLIPETGTRLRVAPLLPGIRRLSGEKLQWYLASELRERIRQSGVRIRIVDRQARKEFAVEPRRFTGRLLHDLPAATARSGEVYLELYLNDADPANQVGLYRSGTRILKSLAELDAFQHAPWTDGFLQGIVDVPFLQLTPATRAGVIHDVAFESLVEALQPVETRLLEIIEEQKRAEEELTSRATLRAIQRAFREALMALPAEEYDWFDINAARRAATGTHPLSDPDAQADAADAEPNADEDIMETGQKQFFEFAGPLFSVRISPAACTLAVGKSRTFLAVPRDRARHRVEDNVAFAWQILEGGGTLDGAATELATFQAPSEPGLVRLGVTASQHETSCTAEALVTVTDSLLPESAERASLRRGLPGYTFEHAPGQLWRSRYDGEQNVIVVNSGHRDFVFASRVKALKLRYIARLFAKEMVCRNFPGLAGPQLLERLIELSLYTEEHLRS
jgi:hypothetical protein